jgi:hypothetical protein
MNVCGFGDFDVGTSYELSHCRWLMGYVESKDANSLLNLVAA